MSTPAGVITIFDPDSLVPELWAKLIAMPRPEKFRKVLRPCLWSFGGEPSGTSMVEIVGTAASQEVVCSDVYPEDWLNFGGLDVLICCNFTNTSGTLQPAFGIQLTTPANGNTDADGGGLEGAWGTTISVVPPSIASGAGTGEYFFRLQLVALGSDFPGGVRTDRFQYTWKAVSRILGGTTAKVDENVGSTTINVLAAQKVRLVFAAPGLTGAQTFNIAGTYANFNLPRLLT